MAEKRKMTTAGMVEMESTKVGSLSAESDFGVNQGKWEYQKLSYWILGIWRDFQILCEGLNSARYYRSSNKKADQSHSDHKT